MKREQIVFNGNSIDLPEGFSKKDYDALVTKNGVQNVKIARIPTSDARTEFVDVVIIAPSIDTTSEVFKFRQVSPKKAWDIMNANCVEFNLDAINASDYTRLSCAKTIEQLIPLGQGEILN